MFHASWHVQMKDPSPHQVWLLLQRNCWIWAAMKYPLATLLVLELLVTETILQKYISEILHREIYILWYFCMCIYTCIPMIWKEALNSIAVSQLILFHCYVRILAGSVLPMLEAVMEVLPSETIAVHFHDTYGQSLANIFLALQVWSGHWL